MVADILAYDENFAFRRDGAYQDIAKILQLGGYGNYVHMPEVGAGIVNDDFKNDGMTKDVRFSAIDFMAKPTTHDLEFSTIKENLYKNMQEIATYLRKTGIESEVIDCRKEGNGRRTRLLIDINQDCFAENVNKILKLLERNAPSYDTDKVNDIKIEGGVKYSKGNKVS